MVDPLRRQLDRSRPGRTIIKLFDNLDRHNAPAAANAMAFDAFISLIPLLALAGWFLNHLHQSGDALVNALFHAAPRPVQSLADTEFLRLSEDGAAAVPPVSLIAFLWVTSSGISTAIGEFEVIFAAPRRGWWRRRLIAIACVLASLVLFAGVAFVTLALAALLGPVGARIFAVALPAVVTLGAVSVFFSLSVRRPRGVKRRLLPGAFVTVALWVLLSVVFSAYVSTLARFATLYGGLATVAIAMLWLWLLSLALLVGGEVNAQLEGVREPGATLSIPPAAPSMPPPALDRASPAPASGPPSARGFGPASRVTPESGGVESTPLSAPQPAPPVIPRPAPLPDTDDAGPVSRPRPRRMSRPS